MRRMMFIFWNQNISKLILRLLIQVKKMNLGVNPNSKYQMKANIKSRKTILIQEIKTSCQL